MVELLDDELAVGQMFYGEYFAGLFSTFCFPDWVASKNCRAVFIERKAFGWKVRVLGKMRVSVGGDFKNRMRLSVGTISGLAGKAVVFCRSLLSVVE